MTATATKIAEAFLAVAPEIDGAGSVLDQESENVEAQRHRWALCVGAVAQALAEQGHLGGGKAEFYAACGVEVRH